MVRTVAEALNLARTIMVARAAMTDITAAERAQVNENVNQIDLTLNALRPDNTVQPGQRAGRAAALNDRCFATITIEQKYHLAPAEFYDGLDLMSDCATVIAAGIPEFESTL